MAAEGPGKDHQQSSEWKLKACFSTQRHVEILVCTCCNCEFSLQHSCRAVFSACGFEIISWACNWEVAELTAASIPVPRAAPGGKKSFTLPPVVYCEAVKMLDGAALGPIGILRFASTRS